MKKYLKISILQVLMLITLYSCDPSHEIEWRIMNNTDKNISIYSKSYQDTTEQYNSLSPNLILQLYYEFDLGTVSNHLKYTKNISFNKLLILNSEGDTIQKDVYNINNWKARNINDAIAQYTLEVNVEDF